MGFIFPLEYTHFTLFFIPRTGFFSLRQQRLLNQWQTGKIDKPVLGDIDSEDLTYNNYLDEIVGKVDKITKLESRITIIGKKINEYNTKPIKICMDELKESLFEFSASCTVRLDAYPDGHLSAHDHAYFRLASLRQSLEKVGDKVLQPEITTVFSNFLPLETLQPISKPFSKAHFESYLQVNIRAKDQSNSFDEFLEVRRLVNRITVAINRNFKFKKTPPKRLMKSLFRQFDKATGLKQAAIAQVIHLLCVFRAEKTKRNISYKGVPLRIIHQITGKPQREYDYAPSTTRQSHESKSDELKIEEKQQKQVATLLRHIEFTWTPIDTMVKSIKDNLNVSKVFERLPNNTVYHANLAVALVRELINGDLTKRQEGIVNAFLFRMFEHWRDAPQFMDVFQNELKPLSKKERRDYQDRLPVLNDPDSRPPVKFDTWVTGQTGRTGRSTTDSEASDDSSLICGINSSKPSTIAAKWNRHAMPTKDTLSEALAEWGKSTRLSLKTKRFIRQALKKGSDKEIKAYLESNKSMQIVDYSTDAVKSPRRLGDPNTLLIDWKDGKNGFTIWK